MKIHISKTTKRLIVASLLTGSLILAPEVCEFPLGSVAYTAVKMYTTTAEDYPSSIESQDVSKLRAKEKAIRSAVEQAGVVLRNYTKTQNLAVTDDEISTVVSNTYQIIGEPVYERVVQKVSNSTVIIWKATVSVNVDDNEIRKWANRTDTEKKNELVYQNSDSKRAYNENEKQLDALRQRAKNINTDEERKQIKDELGKIDKEFLSNQKIEEAKRRGEESLFDEAIELDPNNYRAYYVRGHYFYMKHMFEKAISDYTKAISLNPNCADAYRERGATYEYHMINRKGDAIADYKNAIMCYTKALAANPQDYQLYEKRAFTYANGLRELEKGIDDYTSAIQLNPPVLELVRLYEWRGDYYEINEKYDEAISDYSKMIEIAQGKKDLLHCYYMGYSHRAFVYYLYFKDYEKAIADYTKCIELKPDDDSAYERRAECYKKMGQKDNAVADLAKAAYNAGVRSLFSYKMYESAIKYYFDKAIKLNPDYAEAYCQRGWAYFKLKNYSQAVVDCTKAIELNHQYWQAYNRRGIAYDNLENYAQAISDYTEAIKLKPDDPVLYYNRGVSYKKSKNYSEAIADFTRYIEYKSKNADGYQMRAESIFKAS